MTAPDYPPFRIGEITVSGTLIQAPGVTMPLGGSQWITTDMRRARTRIPPYAIALAVIIGLMTCGLGFLFLLITETVVEGEVQVSVSHGEKAFTTRVPIGVDAQLWDLEGKVRYAQQLSAHFAT